MLFFKYNQQFLSKNHIIREVSYLLDQFQTYEVLIQKISKCCVIRIMWNETFDIINFISFLFHNILSSDNVYLKYKNILFYLKLNIIFVIIIVDFRVFSTFLFYAIILMYAEFDIYNHFKFVVDVKTLNIITALNIYWRDNRK